MEHNYLNKFQRDTQFDDAAGMQKDSNYFITKIADILYESNGSGAGANDVVDFLKTEFTIPIQPSSSPHWAIQCLRDVKQLIEKYNKEAPDSTGKCSNHVYNEINSSLIKNKA